ncbi:MAG: hypothetical protein RBT57_06525 [Paludibacter sp.]|jgi:hypothetical protein|nr:hypothetical protein [Paludibacter sp.]
MKDTLIIATALLISLNSLSQHQSYFRDKTDSEGWFSFNTENNAYIRNVLNDKSIFLVHPEVQKNKNHATWYALNFQGAALSTQAPVTGGIFLPTSFKSDGSPGINDYSNTGSVIFKLPSCTSFKLLCSSNAPYAFAGIYRSTDGKKYSVISESVINERSQLVKDEKKMGQFELTLPSAVYSKDTVYIKIANASAQPLIIHKVSVFIN